MPTTLTADVKHPFACRCSKYEPGEFDKHLDDVSAGFGNALLAALSREGFCHKAQLLALIKILAMTSQAAKENFNEAEILMVLQVELDKPYPRTV